MSDSMPVFMVGVRPVVEYARHGKGAIVVLGSPWSVSNSGLGRADNLRFALNMAGAFAGHGGWIGFDEYHQGYAESGPWALTPPPLKGVIVVLALAGVLFVIACMPRLGTPLPSPEASARTRDEYLSSMAGLLERAGASRLALRTALRSFLNRAGAALGVGRGREADEIVSAARRQGHAAAEAVAAVVERCRRALEAGPVEPAQAVEMAQQLHDTLEALWSHEGRQHEQQRRRK